MSMAVWWVAMGVLAASLWFGRPDTPTISSAAGRSGDVRPGIETGVGTRIDLYGNEISDALADYRVDRRGNLYERHAPHTALLKLGPPGT